MRLSKPIYESLPLLYVVIGTAAIVIAYFEPQRIRSVVAFVIGLLAAIAALTIFLHRQDRREQSREYRGGNLDIRRS
jgi:ABC-type transport system involved in cytochrome c biogenesis permease subunit